MGRSIDVLLFGNPKIGLYGDEQQMTEVMNSHMLCRKIYIPSVLSNAPVSIVSCYSASCVVALANYHLMITLTCCSGV